jgi:hypothetical protein
MATIIPNNPPYPSQDPALAQASVQCDLQEAQDLRRQSEMQVAMQMGVAIQCLRSQKLLLESNHRILVNKTAQLKEAHVAEVNSAVEAVAAEIIRTGNKVEALKERIELSCRMIAKRVLINDLPLFSTLLSEISQISCEGLRRYPEYVDDIRQPMARPQKETALVPPLKALELKQGDLTINHLVTLFMAERESLESEIASISAASGALTHEQEMMGAFHARHMDTIRQGGIEGPLKRTLELVRATYGHIKWKTLFVVDRPYFGNSDLPSEDIMSLNKLAEVEETPLIKIFQSEMLSIISTLEAVVNPQGIRRVL